MMVFMSLYTMVDGVFVSNLVGSSALSAINIVYPAVSIVVAVAIMLASGGSAVIAREMGEGDDKGARKHFSLIILVGVVLGVIFTVVGTVFSGGLSRALGATNAIFDYCNEYLFILALGSPFAVLQMMFQFLFVTAGKPKLGLISTVLGGIANIFFDYLFIDVMNMGIAGAGFGTVIGYSVPAVWGLIYFTINKKGSLYFVKPQFDIKMLTKSCLNGASEMVTNLAAAVVTFLFNYMMLVYLGEDGVAAITIVLYSQFLLTAVFLGFSSGAAPVFSYNYGAGKKDELKNIFKISMIFIAVSSLLAFVLSVVLAGPITAIFVRGDSPVYDIAKNGFVLFSISYIFAGVNIFASAMFTAFSNGLISAIISFLRTFLFLCSSIMLLPLIIGEAGIWLAIPLAEALTLVMALVILVKNKKRYGY